jgi:hypothetical protein
MFELSDTAHDERVRIILKRRRDDAAFERRNRTAANAMPVRFPFLRDMLQSRMTPRKPFQWAPDT